MEEYKKPKLCAVLKVYGYIMLVVPTLIGLVYIGSIGGGELLVTLPVILIVVFIGLTSLWMSEILKHTSKIEHISNMNEPRMELLDNINDETTALKEIMGSYLGYEEEES